MSDLMTACPDCLARDKRIAQLERDLLQAQEAVSTMTRQWLTAVERKKK